MKIRNQQGEIFSQVKKSTSQVYITKEILAMVILEVNIVAHGGEL